MLVETLFTEESYRLSADKETYEVHMVSFWLNERPCFRIYVNNEPGNLFTWDEQAATLQQMDGKAAVPVHLFNALVEKVSGVLATKSADK